jgi:HAE1 family hydrophobic/amphiphilic exporter-1
LEKRFRASPEHLRKLLIATPTGKTVPLESIADIRYSLSPVKIEREDQQRMAKVMISMASRDMGGVIEKIRKMMDTKMVLPNNFYYKIGGQAEDFIASFQMMGVAFFVSVLLVYMVMASQFESLFEPFVILFSIPLSIVGVILALLLTDTSLSVMGLVGIIVLVGIVVNNAIVLIDFVKQHREEHGTPVVEACLEGGRVRLRPILMTAATTICGMIPLALGIGEGAENWAALGRVVIGGLTTSTFLTLFIVPTLYTSFTLYFDKRRAKREAKRAAKLAAQPS